MKIIAPILVLLLIFKIPDLSAQQNDFQIWPSLKVNLAVHKNVRIHLEEEVRFRENATQPGRQINDLGASYKFNRYFRTSLFYRLEADWKNADSYIWRNGFYTDIAVRYPYKRFEAGYRMRLQTARIELNENETGFFSSFRNRHKISLAYNVKGLPINVIADFDLFISKKKSISEVSGYRTWLGIEYTVNKDHTFFLKYGIDRELHVADPVTAYIIALGYTFDVKIYHLKE